MYLLKRNQVKVFIDVLYEVPPVCETYKTGVSPSKSHLICEAQMDRNDHIKYCKIYLNKYVCNID